MVAHYIALDVHCPFTELAVVDSKGRLVKRERLSTAIPTLVDALERIGGKRHLTFEEGPMADWLARSLRERVDDLIVCEPRRNHLIAKDSDKDDPLDAEKLAQLLRGGYLKAVHQPESLARSVFKQHVALYYDRVRQKTRDANRIMAQFRRHGVFVRERQFADATSRRELLAQLPRQALLRQDVLLLWESYDLAVKQVCTVRHRLIQRAGKEEVIRRFCEVPGFGWIRAATIFVYVDTPWRFRGKAPLWRYLGIGLERSHSGAGPTKVRVSQNVNHRLRNAILGAAQTAIDHRDNPFFDQYQRWEDQGLSFRNARRNVARSLAATLWSMWKTGHEYRPELVLRREGCATSDRVS
jgi:transposase